MRDQHICQDFLVGKETIEQTYLAVGCDPRRDLGHRRRLITLLDDDGFATLSLAATRSFPLRRCGILGMELRRVLRRNSGHAQLSRYVSMDSINAVKHLTSIRRAKKACLNSIPRRRLLVPHRSPKRHHEARTKALPGRPGHEDRAARSRTPSLKAGALVVIVNVGFAKDFKKDALRQPVDQPFAAPPGSFPERISSELIDGLAKPGDILVTKRQWGAFHGFKLDLQLRAPRYPDNRCRRRRNEHGRRVKAATTGMGTRLCRRFLPKMPRSGLSAQMHDFAIGNTFFWISRVVKSADLTLSQA